ncbi:hypothetical protein BB559_004986 [Furculomyces boomerangus]|uniref:DUF803-domain-containing protein n=1 Tax=Furculomyces boomerangus TaxID=61424 RepID=A0A2T9YBK8_9FUNG|nr:hypothetical protein BB559_004986 [Furculomyces boomerangus]
MEQKYIGMILAILSSISIGSSFVLTKMGLNDTSRKYGSATKGLAYFKSHIWWLGMFSMAVGEFANFAAYSFAPAILVTPLGALSVIVGAVLASIFLGERINSVGKSGCALCLLGSLQVVVNSPEDPNITSVEQIMVFVRKPLFMFYFFICLAVILLFIYKLSPKYGKKTPIVYITICSLAGSFTVVACKALGIAIKLTISGHNQLVYISTYFFLASVLGCIMLQLNYFNKALEAFNTNIVTPIYYVFFTTLTIVSTTILFEGFSGTKQAFLSITSGFLTLFIGVYLLNHSKEKSDVISDLRNSVATPYNNDSSSSSFDLDELDFGNKYTDSLNPSSGGTSPVTLNNRYSKVPSNFKSSREFETTIYVDEDIPETQDIQTHDLLKKLNSRTSEDDNGAIQFFDVAGSESSSKLNFSPISTLNSSSDSLHQN